MIPRTGIAVSKKELLFILLLFIVYVLVGGAVFMLLESPREDQLREELAELRIEFQEKLDLLEGNSNLSRADMEQLMRRLALIRSNSFLLGDDANDTHTNWSFDNSFFFAITVVTTIGYGHLAPSTTPGRLFCVMYAVVGIPLTGILLAAIGGHYSQHLVRQLHKARRSKNPRLSQLVTGLTCLVPWLMVFLVLPTVLFMFTEGWSFLEGFYYCFITLSTIGFGDYVAGNFKKQYIWLYKLIVLLWIIFGLGYLAMILNYISRAMRCKKLRKVERELSKNFYHTQQRMGQRIDDVCSIIHDIHRQRSIKSRGRGVKRTQSSLTAREAMMRDQNHNNNNSSSSVVVKSPDPSQQAKLGELPTAKMHRRYSLPLSQESQPNYCGSRGSLRVSNDSQVMALVAAKRSNIDGDRLVLGNTVAIDKARRNVSSRYNIDTVSIIDMEDLQATRV